jgi:hypothetical protein
MERPFEAIRITGLDIDQCHALAGAPNLLHLYLQLSDVPPSDWKAIFTREHSMPRGSVWREAWIEGHFILMTCPLEELERYHLEYLKEDVNNTNEKYKLLIAQQEELAARRLQAKEDEKRKLQEINNRLKFS